MKAGQYVIDVSVNIRDKEWSSQQIRLNVESTVSISDFMDAAKLMERIHNAINPD